MAKVSISEAARLTGKSRTTLHRLIKTGELSTCYGERNARMVDVSELLRVFGTLEQRPAEQVSGQVNEQTETGVSAQSEQVVAQLRQEVEHLKALVSAKDSHIDSLKQAMLLLEHKHIGNSSWWKFWKR
ncbi:TPA: helix-turn-helix domain-containing protein [Enterobacter cloacae]|uniref:helix-turn-helix domain-containing protein n=1 Tax=Enterobacter cloacae TaxID=550 RepID=UPI000BA89467|nr:helix-turn-helix domain-containing protein [Enterobacter cloacae]PAO08689.1 DNA-binding protein [Enterobacter cloacae]HAS1130540.1 helix-turn-helix domain-containing protein [Enterobacter cloacae]HAS1158885.1 helix-turn-helix domain-containing protein [Enterobacter cloacae]HAV2133625.1 helix-turn-helix domain-containing protein [Enterobacter cloacae]HAV2230290.1 helix-turn-helix domain-containing protein [Enterobacter cloacae]